MSQAFDFGQLVELCRRTHEETRRTATRAADACLVMRNWLFGWYIVEYEDGRADRSRLYGKKLIERLANELKASGLRGCSPTNLRKFREFYRAYPEIQQTLSVESIPNPPPGNQQTTSINLILPKDANIYASQYQLYLPSKQELKAQLESIQEELGRLREDAT